METLESNPTEFKVVLDTTDVAKGTNLVSYVAYSDDQGNAPDVSGLMTFFASSAIECDGPTAIDTAADISRRLHPGHEEYDCDVCANLSDAESEALAMYDNGGKQIICDPTCLDGVTDPIHCNCKSRADQGYGVWGSLLGGFVFLQSSPATLSRVTPPLFLCGLTLSCCFYFAIVVGNGMVSYAAPNEIVKAIFVRDVQSHSCEWLKPSSEMGVSSPYRSLGWPSYHIFLRLRSCTKRLATCQSAFLRPVSRGRVHCDRSSTPIGTNARNSIPHQNAAFKHRKNKTAVL